MTLNQTYSKQLKGLMYKSLICLLGIPSTLSGQKNITEAEALQIVRERHPAVLSSNAAIRSAQVLRTGASRNWESAEIYHNIAADPDLGMFGTSTFGVTQTFPSARQTRAYRSLYEQQSNLHEAERSLVQHQLSREVRDIFQHLSYLDEKRNRLSALDSLYQQTARIAESRFRNGEVASDERLAARDQAARIRLELETISHETAFDREVLAQFLGENEPLIPVIAPFSRRVFSLADTARIREGAFAQVDAGKARMSEALTAVEKARRSPLFTAGVNVQYLGNGALYPGYTVGLRLPLAQQTLRARASAANASTEAARAQLEATVRSQQMELAHLLHEVEKYEILLEYYEKEGKLLAAELRRSAFQRYVAGESDFLELVQSAERALRMEMEYLDHLHMLNRTVLEIEMLF